ncbi:hypothetical protein N483_13335 [Pseudoalteromonas luteoviolacea NCIMB 1944]|nr:hypothetical protein N483_13335 [Pseudoalteromonas luteoviolacea NCIMB 1944]
MLSKVKERIKRSFFVLLAKNKVVLPSKSLLFSAF